MGLRKQFIYNFVFPTWAYDTGFNNNNNNYYYYYYNYNNEVALALKASTIHQNGSAVQTTRQMRMKQEDKQ